MKTEPVSAAMEADVTRRGFVKGSLSAGAGALLGTRLAGRLYAAGSDRIRVGLVGCGGRGIYAGISNCAQSAPGVQLTAVGDLFPERAAQAPEKIKANLEKLLLPADEICRVGAERIFHGWDAYLQVIRSDVDMVIFTTPPFFRPQHLRACVEAGKHAFVEKPIATDPAGVRQFLETADQAGQKGLTLVAGTQMRRAKHLQALMARIHDGALGSDLSGQSLRLGGALRDLLPVAVRDPAWSDMEWQLRRWLFYTWLSGDFIVEQHVHNLDLINWAMGGPPVQCVAMGGRLARTEPEFGNCYDHIAVDYEYPDGARVTHLGRQMDQCSDRNGIQLQGSRGRAIFDFGNAKIEGDRPFLYEGPRVEPAVQEYADMIAAIRNNEPINEGRQVAEATMTALLGRMSAYTGRAIKWDWAMKRSTLDLSPPALAFGELQERPVAIPGVTKLI